MELILYLCLSLSGVMYQRKTKANRAETHPGCESVQTQAGVADQ